MKQKPLLSSDALHAEPCDTALSTFLQTVSRTANPENRRSADENLRDRLLDRQQVEEIYGLPKRWLELAAHKGSGPPYLKISRRMVRYRAADIEAWLECRRLDPSEVGGD